MASFPPLLPPLPGLRDQILDTACLVPLPFTGPQPYYFNQASYADKAPGSVWRLNAALDQGLKEILRNHGIDPDSVTLDDEIRRAVVESALFSSLPAQSESTSSFSALLSSSRIPSESTLTLLGVETYGYIPPENRNTLNPLNAGQFLKDLRCVNLVLNNYCQNPSEVNKKFAQTLVVAGKIKFVLGGFPQENDVWANLVLLEEKVLEGLVDEKEAAEFLDLYQMALEPMLEAEGLSFPQTPEDFALAVVDLEKGLKEKWREISSDAFLFAPKSPENEDGDLPVSLAWAYPSFSYLDEQRVWDSLYANPCMRPYFDDDALFESIVVYLKNFRLESGDESLTQPKPGEPYSVNYSSVRLPPTRIYAESQAEGLFKDLNHIVASYQKPLNSTSEIKSSDSLSFKMNGISQVVVKMEEVARLPQDVSTALRAWPAYQAFLSKIETESPLFGRTVPAFLRFEIDATALYSKMQSLDSSYLVPLQSLVGFASGVDALEAEMTRYLPPDLALKVGTRLRYVFYLAQSRASELESQKIPESSEEFRKKVDRDLRAWVSVLDRNWPSEDGRTTTREGGDVINSDLDFSPTGAFYISEEDFYGLFDPQSRTGLGLKADQAVHFFTDYSEGYYRSFCPLSYEKDINGNVFKAVRDQTSYWQLITTLENLAAQAETILASDTDNKLSSDDLYYYHSLVQISYSVSANLRAFLERQPYSPFWSALDENGEVMFTVPHEMINPVPLPGQPQSPKAVLARAKVSLYQAQYTPFDSDNPDSVWGAEMVRGEAASLFKNENLVFKLSDLEGVSMEEWENLARLLQSWKKDGNYQVRAPGFVLVSLEKNVEKILRYGSADPNDPVYVVLVSTVVQDLNQLVNPVSPTAFPDFAWLGDEASGAVDDYFVSYNIFSSTHEPSGFSPVVLIKILDCLGISYPSDRTELQAATLSFYDEEMKKNPYETKEVSRTLDFMLARGTPEDALYVVGRLLERIKPSSSRLSFYDVEQELSRLSTIDIGIISGKVSAATLSDQGHRFLAELSPEQRVWVPAYFAWGLAAYERVNQDDDDSVYYENVRRTDLDRMIASVADPFVAAHYLLEKYAPEMTQKLWPDPDSTLSTYAGRLELNFVSYQDWVHHFDVPTALQLSSEIRSSYVDLRSQREKLDPIYSVFGRRTEAASSFNSAERLYFFARFSERQNNPKENWKDENYWLDYQDRLIETSGQRIFRKNSQMIDDWLVVLDEAPEVERETVYAYVLMRIQDDEENILQSLEDKYFDAPLLNVEGFPQNENGVDRYWAWSSRLLDEDWADFNDEAKKALVREMDYALDADFGKTGERLVAIDPFQQRVMRQALSQASYALSGTDDPEIVQKREVVLFLEKALFEPYDPLDPNQLDWHSRYNPNAKANTEWGLKELFTPEAIRLLSAHANASDVVPVFDANPVEARLFLIGFYELLTGSIQDEEKFILRTWNNPRLLEAFESVFKKLNKNAGDFLRTDESPFASGDDGEIQSKLDLLHVRLEYRLQEIETENILDELTEIWQVTEDDQGNFVFGKKQNEISQQDIQRSDELIAELREVMKLLNSKDTPVVNVMNQQYRTNLAYRSFLLIDGLT